MLERSEELAKKAYKELDQEKRWDYIAEIQKRGTRAEFDLAKKLTQLDDPVKREIGADILGQLGWQKNKFCKASVKILISLLHDSSEDVICAAATAIGHREAPEALQHFIKLKSHPNDDVRYSIAFALGGYEDKQAIKALIELSTDPDPFVRDWATFNLGSQCEYDNLELRDALKARLSDEVSESRGEALIGLAKRKQTGIEECILKELNGDEIYILAVEASEITAHKKLKPALTRWKSSLNFDDEDDYFKDKLDDAIKACS